MYADPRIERIERKYTALRRLMDERFVRCWAAAEARDLGRGGISIVAAALRMSRTTVYHGLEELPAKAGPVRRPGGGRRRRAPNDPLRLAPLEKLIAPRAPGATKSPLRWSVRSTEDLADELTGRGHPACARHVAALLIGAGYRLEGRRKPRTEDADRARNEQLRRLNSEVRQFLEHKQPAIYLDLKTRKLPPKLGQDFGVAYGNGLRQGTRQRVYKESAVPNGFRLDLTNTRDWKTIALGHDTTKFATESVRNWWKRIGRHRFRRAKELLVAVDAGSNGHRSRFWAKPLEKLRDELGVKVCVRHFPAATTKWNRLDCRQFSIIMGSHRGRPVARHQAIVSLIASP